MSNADINTTATREIANDLGNPCSPIFDDNKMTDPGPEDRTAVRAAFTGTPWVHSPPLDPQVEAVGLALVRMIPRLGIAPTGPVEAHQLEFRWARVRCLLAGFGHTYHAAMATELATMWPDCPLDPRESLGEWLTAAKAARFACGWPLSMSAAPWRGLAWRSDVESSYRATDWERTLAALHVAKHVRLGAARDRLVTVYERPQEWERDENSTLAFTDKYLPKALALLGCPGKLTGKRCNPMTLAVASFLKVTGTGELVRRKSLVHLPGTVLHDTGSGCRVWPANLGGFIQSGVTLDRVRFAMDGEVIDASTLDLDHDDIVGYEWPTTTGDAVPRINITTYDPDKLPATVMDECFPNMLWSGIDNGAAHRALFDAVLVAQVLRSRCPRLKDEFPFMCFMPASAEPDQTTNQGKTQASEAVLHALSPCATMLGATTSGAEQNARSLAAYIEQDGTVGMDEWELRASAFLDRAKIQELCTGRTVNVGKVYENDKRGVKLGAPLVANCKAVQLPPDMINRFFFFRLRDLTDAERRNYKALERASSGRLSLEMRLAAVAAVERLDLVNWMNTVPIPGVANNRYNSIHALAARLYLDRIGDLSPGLERASAVVVNALIQCVAAYHRHTQEASASNLLSILEHGEDSTLHVVSAFSGLIAADMPAYTAHLRVIRGQQRKGNTAADLLRGLAALRGSTDEPLSVLAAAWVGAKSNICRMGDRGIARALLKDLKLRMPHPGAAIPFPDSPGYSGWFFRRLEDAAHGPMFEVFTDNPANKLLA